MSARRSRWILRCPGPGWSRCWSGWSLSAVCDNGSKFTGQTLDAWAYRRGVKIEFIGPGKPVANCFIESFKGSFRDECLNEHWFTSLADARRTIER